VRGLSPLHAGLLTLPMAAMTALLPPISGRMVATRGTRLPLMIGGAGIAASGGLLLTLDVEVAAAARPAWVVVIGVRPGGAGAGPGDHHAVGPGTARRTAERLAVTVPAPAGVPAR
jgi:hypothetical protein